MVDLQIKGVFAVRAFVLNHYSLRVGFKLATIFGCVLTYPESEMID